MKSLDLSDLLLGNDLNKNNKDLKGLGRQTKRSKCFRILFAKWSVHLQASYLSGLYGCLYTLLKWWTFNCSFFCSSLIIFLIFFIVSCVTTCFLQSTYASTVAIKLEDIYKYIY